MGEDKRASLDALCNIPISNSIRTFSYDYILITKISYMSLYGSKRNACVDADLFGGDFWILSYLTKHNTFFIIKACKILVFYYVFAYIINYAISTPQLRHILTSAITYGIWAKVQYSQKPIFEFFFSFIISTNGVWCTL